jgi:hypothetical protein
LTRGTRRRRWNGDRERPEWDEAQAAQPQPEAGDVTRALSEEQAGLLLLQQTVGNRALGNLLRRAGSTLPVGTRTRMERRLGADLAQVEVQTGPEAAEAARRLGARAYAFGNRIGFAEGEYAPGTPEGDALLAHELAHVAQHARAGGPVDARQLTGPSHPSERQATAAASGQPTALDAAPPGLALLRDEGKAQPDEAAAPFAGAPLPARRQQLAAAEQRARGFLDRHHAGLRAAIGSFVAAAATRLAAGHERIVDPAALIGALTGVTANFLAAALPKVGPVIGRALVTGVQPGDFAGQEASGEAGATRVLRRFGAASELSLLAGFKQAGASLAPLMAGLEDSDLAARAALETGSQDEMKALVEGELGIPDPDRGIAYEDLRQALEEELDLWLEVEPPPEGVEDQTALAPPAGADDEAGGQGKKQPQTLDKTGKVH